MIKCFIEDYNTKYDNFILELNAGYIQENGIIDKSQKGIEDTFSIGMPIYDKNKNKLGYLSIGLYKWLNYSDITKEKIDIPVEYWEIKNYKGKCQRVFTYHQIYQEDIKAIEKGEI